MAKHKKPLGPQVPCKPGKYHSVSMFSGVCSVCGKQIHAADPEKRKAFQEVFGKVQIM